MKRSTIGKALGILVLILFLATMFQSDESKYRELTSKLPSVNYVEIEREDKAHTHVLISSSECPACLEFIELLYAYLANLEGQAALLSIDDLSDQEKENLAVKYKLKEIPAILILEKGQYRVLSSSQLKEAGVITDES